MNEIEKKEIAQKFTRYEEIKKTIAALETEMDELKPEIISFVPEGKDVEGEFGTFSVQPRATWKFSPKHKSLKEDLKSLEEREKAEGIATATYSPVLFYKQAKVEESLAE